MSSEMIKEDFVIQGILKEMMLADSIFSIEDSAIRFKIVDLIEEKIRDSSQNKKLLIKLVGENFLLQKELKVTGGFYRNLIRFESTVIESVSSSLFYLKIPSTLEIKNVRKDDRTPVKPELRKACPVLLVTNGVHCEGTFTIEDTSVEGVGGLLQVPSGYPCGPTTQARGKLYLDKGEIELDGTMVRVNVLPERKHGYDVYNVGIKQVHIKAKREQGAETRRHERLAIKHQVTLVPLIHPDLPFQIDLVDISVAGFSGSPVNGQAVPSFPVGTIFEIKDQSTKAILVQFNHEVFRFHITSREEQDAIKWLRTMTPVLYPGAQCSVKDARDLYKIFLQAGAISTQYLKRHELYENALVKEHANIEDESAYLHRWYVAGENKEIEAHISAIRVADNCWFLGDLAKSTGSQIDGEEFVKKFFHSIAKSFYAVKPTPVLMGMWLEKHPLWQKWNDKLKINNKNTISNIALQYIRTTRKSNSNVKKFVFNAISSSDFERIKKINAALTQNINSFLEYVLDFSLKSLGSQSLYKLIKGFERNYFEITDGKNISALVITTKYPTGTSLNRVMDSIYVALLTKSASKSELDGVIETAVEIGVRHGVVVPAIRFIREISEKFEKSSSDMTVFVLTPLEFSLFEGFK